MSETKEVLLKVKVVAVDLKAPGDTTQTYTITDGAPSLRRSWITDADIFAVVGEEPKAGSGRVDSSAPQDTPRRLTVGDKVTSNEYPNLGIGTIVRDDHDKAPYRVEWPNGAFHWQSEDDVTRAEPDRPTVGDWVKIIDGVCGMGETGKITKDDHTDIPFRVESESGEIFWKRAERVVKVPPPAPKPQPKYHAGQKVVHAHALWGVGTIVELSDKGVHPCWDRNDNSGDCSIAKGLVYLVDFPNRPSVTHNGWYTLEQNLIAISE